MLHGIVSEGVLDKLDNVGAQLLPNLGSLLRVFKLLNDLFNHAQTVLVHREIDQIFKNRIKDVVEVLLLHAGEHSL